MADLELTEIVSISIKPTPIPSRVSTIELILKEDSKWWVKDSSRRIIRGIERDSDYDGEVDHDEREIEYLIEAGSEYEKKIRERLKPIAEQLGLNIDELSLEELNLKTIIRKSGYYKVGEVYKKNDGSRVFLN